MIKKNILIISATSRKNLKLAENIKKCIDINLINISLINLEDYNIPLFTEDFFDENKLQYLDEVKSITEKFINADGIIICGPEYNGSLPPIINNTIAWISTSTKYWRDAFADKIGLLCSHSGGPGTKFIFAMKMQLEHLGMTIIHRNITVNDAKSFNPESAKKILKQFINLL